VKDAGIRRLALALVARHAAAPEESALAVGTALPEQADAAARPAQAPDHQYSKHGIERSE